MRSFHIALTLCGMVTTQAITQAAPITQRIVTQISGGYEITCALFQDGSVRCWGYGGDGSLGNGSSSSLGSNTGDITQRLTPVPLGADRTAISISVGDSHVCAILDNNDVKCWGDNSFGELGLGDTTNRGTVAAQMGDNLPKVPLGTGRSALSIAAGSTHNCAVLDNHKVKCWGQNTAGKLGLGDVLTRGSAVNQMGDNLPEVNLGTNYQALKVAAGGNHTCAILSGGSVKCWGSNTHGQLGLGDILARGDKPGTMGDALPAVNLGTGKTAVSIYAGPASSCALLNDGTLKCWGDNETGQLGLGDQAPRGTTAATLGDALPAVDLGTLPISSVECSRTGSEIDEAFCCAVFINHAAKCWGGNGRGQLGIESRMPRGSAPGQMGEASPFVDLGPFVSVKQVTTAKSHACAILTDGSVKCWGSNGSGEIGLEDAKERGSTPGTMGANLPKLGL